MTLDQILIIIFILSIPNIQFTFQAGEDFIQTLQETKCLSPDWKMSIVPEHLRILQTLFLSSGAYKLNTAFSPVTWKTKQAGF